MGLTSMARHWGLLVIFLSVLPLSAEAQSFTKKEQEVWRQEREYWNLYTSGNIEGYMALWTEDFVGWPAKYEKPVGKSGVRDNAENTLRNTRPGSYRAQLEPLSARTDGDIVIVFYRVDTTRTDPTGATLESHFRITHTWKRTAGNWKIIAGMSANEMAR